MKRSRGTARRSTHVVDSPTGPRARMVDVGAKAPTARAAIARAEIEFPRGVLRELLAGRGRKGPVLETARIAGIQAAKRTSELVPLCHPLALDAIDVEMRALDARRLEITCRASCTGRTGVEMEALVGAALAALTVYDMGKGLDHGIAITRVELVEKHGGKSGPWKKPARGRSA